MIKTPKHFSSAWRAAFAAAFLMAGMMWFQSARAVSPTAPFTDFNADGCVDGRDLIMLALHFDCCGACTDPADPGDCTDPDVDCIAPAGCPCSATAETCFDAAFDAGPLDSETLDPDPDGKIDLTDVAVLSGEFTDGCS